MHFRFRVNVLICRRHEYVARCSCRKGSQIGADQRWEYEQAGGKEENIPFEISIDPASEYSLNVTSLLMICRSTS
jgi:hypothetical protein